MSARLNQSYGRVDGPLLAFAGDDTLDSHFSDNHRGVTDPDNLDVITMRSVRDVLLRYLDAKQHLWNTYFIQRVSNLMECEPLDSFEAIDALLFKVLVCQTLGFELPESHALGTDVVPQIKVIPRQAVTEIPIRFEAPRRDDNHYWEAQANFSANGVEGQFIEFFQWDSYDYLSMPYVKVRMAQFPAQPSKVGTEALIEIVNVDFVS